LVAVAYNGTVPSPVGQVIINEVMYNPPLPGAEYVELYNISSTTTYDLSGWQFRGLSYTFPAGAVIGPRSYLVLAANPLSFAAAYGATTPVFDTFSGTLQVDGETLSLVQPGTNAATDLVVAKLRYGAAPPWPAAANSLGGSLQLLDSRQDNWRLANWTALPTNALAAPQWVFVTTNIPATSSTLYLYLGSAGDIYLDEVKVLRSGTNALLNGDFEAPLTSGWTATANFTNSGLSTAVRHGGNSSLHLVASAAGSGSGNSLYQLISPALVTNQTYTLSFWYLQSTNGAPLIARFSGSVNPVTLNPAPPLSSLARATPGVANSVAGTLSTFPSLWLNEVQPENLTGLTNRAGQRTPWLELYNPGTNTLALEGLYLANNLTNLLQWAFPAGASLSPGQFKVLFADGLTNLSTLSELHTSFGLPAGAGTLVLSRLSTNAQVQVLDYLSYTNLSANHSFGSLPDGQAFERQEFFFATPGGTNNGSSAPITVLINEWMADNTGSLADPADNDFEDWFELYNPGTNAVDLGGFYLSDTLTNKFQFEIPNTHQYVIPPHGFLLVWADGESKQNATNRADLHVNFKLDKAGEAIGLFGADGVLVDYVSFGPQISDVSLGRYPDGSSTIAVLPRATPRASNAAPNTAPVLAPIPDQIVILGQTLTLTAMAADTDLPPQALAFSLGAGAPAGATIDVSSGQFSWTPTNAPSTNLLSIVVSDNGVPSLTATQSFNVVAMVPPLLGSVSLNGNQFTFACSTLVGHNYQVEYKDSLSVVNWTPLGDSFTATSSMVTVTNAVNTSAQRFFRVRLLP
ncbi:MAG TPA: lamin tail domain-containing protein, partial [Candidatus Sulfotelmatobacter sp.]|nr:lamin tail domain-containing protein [Candidatus Sulfotelmatobacter sp.]